MEAHRPGILSDTEIGKGIVNTEAAARYLKQALLMLYDKSNKMLRTDVEYLVRE